MSTAPRIGYAKSSNKNKNKGEANSAQFLNHSKEVSKNNDLFSHMNQENLNYIKKQLKLKKSKSTKEDRGRDSQKHKQIIDQNFSNNDEAMEENLSEEYEETPHPSEKIYQKYQGKFNQQEDISEKQERLEETQRISEEESSTYDNRQDEKVDKNVKFKLNHEDEDSYPIKTYHQNLFHPAPKPSHQQSEHSFQNKISTSQRNAYEEYNTKGGKNESNVRKRSNDEPLMYRSSPYQNQDNKQRTASIEGYLGEAVSVNLNTHQASNFIDFLQSYISDLNQSHNPQTSRKSSDQLLLQHQSRKINNPFTKKQMQIKDLSSGDDVDNKINEGLEERRKVERNKKNVDKHHEVESVSSNKYGAKNSSNLNQYLNLSQKEYEQIVESSSNYAAIHIKKLEDALRQERFNNIILSQEMAKIKQQILEKQLLIQKLSITMAIQQEDFQALNKKFNIIMENNKMSIFGKDVRKEIGINKNRMEHYFVQSQYTDYIEEEEPKSDKISNQVYENSNEDAKMQEPGPAKNKHFKYQHNHQNHSKTLHHNQNHYHQLPPQTTQLYHQHIHPFNTVTNRKRISSKDSDFQGGNKTISLQEIEKQYQQFLKEGMGKHINNVGRIKPNEGRKLTHEEYLKSLNR